MKIEYKVVYSDVDQQPTGGVGDPERLELRLNEFGEEGWSAAAVTASGNGGYLVVLTRPSEVDTDGIQLVQLAIVHRIRQTVQRLVGRASISLGRPRPSQPPTALPR